MNLHRTSNRLFQLIVWTAALGLAGSCAVGIEDPNVQPSDLGINPGNSSASSPVGTMTDDVGDDSEGETSSLPDASEANKDFEDEQGPDNLDESGDIEDSMGNPGNKDKLCGNGTREKGEECDGDDLAGMSCKSVTGHSGGKLSCRHDCRFDTAQCYDPKECGDGELQWWEGCDCGDDEECSPAELNHKSCEDFGFARGSLGCGGLEACQFDTTGCSNCGDGVLDPNEECDGNALDSNTCQSLGWTEGNLRCDSSCHLDVTQCSYDFKAADRKEDCRYYEVKSQRPLLDSDHWPVEVFDFGDLGIVHEVVVKLSLTHPRSGDLSATLRHGGESRIVMDRPGLGTWDEGCPYRNVRTSIFGRASGSFENACRSQAPSIEGRFRPVESLEVFRGHKVSGPWEVEVRDATVEKSGYLYGVCVEVLYRRE